LGYDVRVVDTGRDTHDAAGSRADVGVVFQRIGAHDVSVDGVLPREQLLRDALADQYCLRVDLTQGRCLLRSVPHWIARQQQHFIVQARRLK